MNASETTINEEDLFKLSAPVGIKEQNNPLDVAKIESVLGATGHLNLEKTNGPTGFYGKRLEGAIKSFQNEENLKVDGLIKPEGETIAQVQEASEDKKEKEDKKEQDEKPIKENALISLFRWISEEMGPADQGAIDTLVGGIRGQK